MLQRDVLHWVAQAHPAHPYAPAALFLLCGLKILATLDLTRILLLRELTGQSGEFISLAS